jgi:hypothetical protein
MVKRKIVWTSNASNQLIGVLEFYADRNKNKIYSNWLLNEIEKRIELINRYPNLGRVTSSNNVRLLPFNFFGIFYSTNDEILFINSIWDFRQNPEKRIDFEPKAK